MTSEESFLEEVKPIIQGYVTFGYGRKGKIKGICKMARLELPCLKDVLLVKDLTANLISISQLCNQGFIVSFIKEEYVNTKNERGQLIKGSRFRDNCYIWKSESTYCKTFKEEKKAQENEENDKLAKGRMSNSILEYPAQNLVSTRKGNMLKSLVTCLSIKLVKHKIKRMVLIIKLKLSR